MKRFAVLALLAAFILGTVGVAQAVEIKAKGTWRVHFDYVANKDFGLAQGVDKLFHGVDKKSKDDKFEAVQRMRTIFEFVASENLKGVLHLEIGNTRWGRSAAGNMGGNSGGALNADGVNIKTKHAYINFKLPGTAVDIRAGIQPVGLPSTLGSRILAADVGALVANVPFNDMLGLTLGWARPFDQDKRNPYDRTRKWDDEVDVFVGVLPVSMDGVSLKPFVSVSRWGKDFIEENFGGTRAKNATMWHAGLNFAVTMLDPIAILGDFNYGHVKWFDDYKQTGWVADLAVQYAMDMVTPQLFFAYETGEKSFSDSGNKSNRMPTIGTDGGDWGPGIGFTYGNFAYGAYTRGLLAGITDALFGEVDPGFARYLSHQSWEGAVGLWAVGAALRNINFMENLSHELVAYYAKGTNHKDNAHLMTTKDSYWEVDFNTTYQMYENLALVLELAYAKVKLDDMGGNRSDLAGDALMRGVLGVVYRF